MQQLDRGLVTPDAVLLELDVAGIGSRILARTIDSIIQAAALVSILLVVTFLTGAGVLPGAGAVVVMVIASFVALVVYPAAFEAAWRGRTPGKAALGLRVVTLEGAPVRFRHAAARAALGLVEIVALSGFPAVMAMLLTRRSQRLGDLVAGSMVVRERSGAAAPEVARFTLPPGTEAYAATVDVGGLDQAGYAAVRSFLLRAPTLPPDARQRIAAEVATPVAARLRHTPPPGMPAELFLAVVAARAQARWATEAPLPQPAPSQPVPSQALTSQPPAPPAPAPQPAAPPSGAPSASEGGTGRERREPPPPAASGGFAPPG